MAMIVIQNASSVIAFESSDIQEWFFNLTNNTASLLFKTGYKRHFTEDDATQLFDCFTSLFCTEEPDNVTLPSIS